MNQKVVKILIIGAQILIGGFLIYIWFFKPKIDNNKEIYCSYYIEEYSGRIEKKFRTRDRNVATLVIDGKETQVFEWVYLGAEVGDSIKKRSKDDYYVIFKNNSVDSLNVRSAYLSRSKEKGNVCINYKVIFK